MKASLTISVILLLLNTTSTFASPLGTRSLRDNGTILLVATRPQIPMVVMHVLLKTGAATDPAGKAGLANLTAELLTRGTQKYSADVLAEELDFLGAALGVDVDYDTTTVTLTTLTKNLKPALTLLAQVLTKPSFPAEELERKRKEIEGGLQSREEDPSWVAQKAFLRKLYPDHHPYGRLISGTAKTLATLTTADAQQFHQAYYRPNNAIIAMVGDITQKQATALLGKTLADWQAADIPTSDWPQAPAPAVTRIVLNKQVSQANVILGHQGVARSNPDYYAVQVMNYILGGGGFESRLMKKIREELALVYHVSSGFAARKHPGPFTLSLQTKNASATQAVEESLQTMRRFIEQGITSQELEAAKAYYINSFPLRLVSNRSVAGLLPLIEFYELGLDYPDRYADLISQVTLEQVHTAAKTYLHPDHLLQVIVANLTEAGLAQQEAEETRIEDE